MELHFEVELAVIVGTQVRDLDERDEKAATDAIDCNPPSLWPSSSFLFIFSSLFFSLSRIFSPLFISPWSVLQ